MVLVAIYLTPAGGSPQITPPIIAAPVYTTQVDCKSGFDSAPCSAASVSGTVSYPIDWTVGTGAKMNEDWCPMTANTDADECPSERFAECYPFVSDSYGFT